VLLDDPTAATAAAAVPTFPPLLIRSTTINMRFFKFSVSEGIYDNNRDSASQENRGDAQIKQTSKFVDVSVVLSFAVLAKEVLSK
jgi:hypothetical protein